MQLLCKSNIFVFVWAKIWIFHDSVHIKHDIQNTAILPDILELHQPTLCECEVALVSEWSVHQLLGIALVLIGVVKLCINHSHDTATITTQVKPDSNEIDCKMCVHEYEHILI